MKKDKVKQEWDEHRASIVKEVRNENDDNSVCMLRS